VADLQEIDHCILDSETPESFIRELEMMDMDYTLV
jgi:DeoR family fructose operon transcriptional repressor